MANMKKIYQVWVLRNGNRELSPLLTEKQAEQYYNAEKAGGYPVQIYKMDEYKFKTLHWISWVHVGETFDIQSWKEYYRKKSKK